LRHRLISPMFIRNASLIYEPGNLAFLVIPSGSLLPAANLGHSVFPPWSTPHKYREGIFVVDAEFPSLF
jgi:hypothetical protein